MLVVYIVLLLLVVSSFLVWLKCRPILYWSQHRGAHSLCLPSLQQVPLQNHPSGPSGIYCNLEGISQSSKRRLNWPPDACSSPKAAHQRGKQKATQSWNKFTILNLNFQSIKNKKAETLIESSLAMLLNEFCVCMSRLSKKLEVNWGIPHVTQFHDILFRQL
jgi:hypothetical protein